MDRCVWIRNKSLYLVAGGWLSVVILWFATRLEITEVKSSTVKYSKNMCYFEYFLTYFMSIFIENSGFQKDCQIREFCLNSTMGGGMLTAVHCIGF